LVAGLLAVGMFVGADRSRAEPPHAQHHPVVLNLTVEPDGASAARLARLVTIYRDAWGVPHIDGPTDESVVFGMAYAQAEDFFWQVEDTYILGLGRYSEAHGPSGLNSDLLNRAFEIVPRSRADYAGLEPEVRSLFEAFVAGLNYYLETHSEVKPRLIAQFEPWQLLAVGRQLTLEMTFRHTRLSSSYLPRSLPNISAAVGSNGWAIGPQRTKSRSTMLLVNPHQPWFGFGQFYEAHLRSGEGWNFAGAAFYGAPLPSLGHNDNLGFTFTTNEPDVADVWRETFDDPRDPLAYRYDDGYRRATAWDETLRVKTRDGFASRSYHFVKTHHGPIVAKEDASHRLAVQIGRFYDSVLLRQQRQLVRARTLDEFQAALAMNNFTIMNVLYADRQGNIFYQYNGTVPRRDPQFDWSKPVDGSDPRTEWQGYHTQRELPRLLNPPEGYLQNCNSSPFTTTDGTNPSPADYPGYMVEEKHDDKRRAKRSRALLSGSDELTLDRLRTLAYDTTLYWAETELPRYAAHLEQLKQADPALAAEVAPYLEHLLDWDCRVTIDSTQATLCVAWYEVLYGVGYPGETLHPQFEGNPPQQLRALIHAAKKLQRHHGSWRVRYGDVYRIQRHADVADMSKIPFRDTLPSLPCAGAHGPMGVVFTQYYTPTLNIPLIRTLENHYGVLGPTYLSAIEFGERVRAATVVNFGSSGDPASPHYFDQARLLSERKLKPELFYWSDVLAGATHVYHPGEPHSPVVRPDPRAENRDGTEPRS